MICPRCHESTLPDHGLLLNETCCWRCVGIDELVNEISAIRLENSALRAELAKIARMDRFELPHYNLADALHVAKIALDDHPATPVTNPIARCSKKGVRYVPKDTDLDAMNASGSIPWTPLPEPDNLTQETRANIQQQRILDAMPKRKDAVPEPENGDENDGNI